HTQPARTAPKAGMSKVPSGAAAFMISPASGSRMPKEPQEVPVANAMPAAMRNKIGTNQIGVTDKLVTMLAKYAPVPSSLIKEPSIQANNSMKMAGNMDFAPSKEPRVITPAVNFSS